MKIKKSLKMEMSSSKTDNKERSMHTKIEQKIEELASMMNNVEHFVQLTRKKYSPSNPYITSQLDGVLSLVATIRNHLSAIELLNLENRMSEVAVEAEKVMHLTSYLQETISDIHKDVSNVDATKDDKKYH